jgi:hypothetical protein
MLSDPLKIFEWFCPFFPVPFTLKKSKMGGKFGGRRLEWRATWMFSSTLEAWR